jgi:hypothetical protein
LESSWRNISVKDTGQAERECAEEGSRLTRAALEAAIRSVEERAFLVRPRVLRRVILEDRQLAGLTVRLPHRKSYLIGREPLLEIVAPDELGLDSAAGLPDRVILLPQPSETALAETPGPAILLSYWRLLFHARIHLEFEERIRAGRLPAESILRRIRQIGRAEFDEIRAVLAQEAYLLPPRDEASVYVEFAAVYWELRYFAQPLLPRYFPSIEDFRLVEAALGEDVEAKRILAATRLPGAPDPKTRTAAHDREDAGAGAAADAPVAAPWTGAPREGAYRRWIRRAEAAAELGNLVRSSICRARAEQAAPQEHAGKARTALKRDVDRLVRRLQVALAADDEDPQPWQETLLALARQAPAGIWTAEARLLYDLQKVCIDHERGIYRLDLAGWAASLGKQPIKRALPALRKAAISKHLRAAARRLPFVRMTDAGLQKLSHLLETAMHRAETRLRDRFRPVISRTLDDVGLDPRNLPEKVAFRKLVEEMLDRIVETGYLTMGDLRDGLSRNNLKLPDFSWREDVLRGDPLLRADRRLAASLDGVYRGGEFYLRWMQRLSSLGFGTSLGRVITRYLAVPFGGTFLVVAFLDHVVEKITGTGPTTASATWSVLRILVLGAFVLGLVNVPRFRREVGQTVLDVGGAARDAVVGAAQWIARWEWLQQFLRSRLARLAYRFALKPAAITAVAWIALPLEAVGWRTSLPSGVGLFLVVNLFLNSRLGRDFEELLIDGLVQAWRRLGMPILTGLYYFFVDVFRGILETVERLLYTVDEWLRFRTGETRLTFATKAVLGTGWYLVTYVLRFCINLLIEPQINPLKHFPVVTVSHKFLLPFIPAFGKLLSQTLDKELAYTVAGLVITGIPGIFGFLVWELKENWRLYAANRARTLRPAIVGQHGETMVRLFRPGFHSGTVPKLFAKLRRVERRALFGDVHRAAHKQLRAVRRVQLAIRQFIERELVDLVSLGTAWDVGPIALGAVRLGTNRVHLALNAAEGGDGPLEIRFEMRSGRLVSGVVRLGWATRLGPADRQVLSAALVGLYKLAGVDLVREQIDAQLPHATDWDIAGQRLVLAPQGDLETEVVYPLDAGGRLDPQVTRGELWRAMPTLDARQVLFSQVPVLWEHWVAFWEEERLSPKTADLIVSIRVLPEE